MSIRLGVVGSRTWSPLLNVGHYLDGLEEEVDCIVSGGARGVDAAAEGWALERGVTVVSFRPRAEGMGFSIIRITRTPDKLSQVTLPGRYLSFPAAAFVRNGFIVEFSDAVVAFWNRTSRGTKDSIDRARAIGNLRAIIYEGE